MCMSSWAHTWLADRNFVYNRTFYDARYRLGDFACESLYTTCLFRVLLTYNRDSQDQPEYRIGVILVGIARCIAMVESFHILIDCNSMTLTFIFFQVMIWNQLAGGDHNYW